MVTVVLKKGDFVRVEVAEGDGAFEIAHTANELTVAAEFAGSDLGSDGLIWRDVFGCTCDGAAVVDMRCPEHGNLDSISIGKVAEETGILVP